MKKFIKLFSLCNTTKCMGPLFLPLLIILTFLVTNIAKAQITNEAINVIRAYEQKEGWDIEKKDSLLISYDTGQLAELIRNSDKRVSFYFKIGSQTWFFNLEHKNMHAKNCIATVHYENRTITIPVGPSNTYIGTVDGDPDMFARFVIFDGQLKGSFRSGDSVIYISPEKNTKSPLRQGFFKIKKIHSSWIGQKSNEITDKNIGVGDADCANSNTVNCEVVPLFDDDLQNDFPILELAIDADFDYYNLYSDGSTLNNLPGLDGGVILDILGVVIQSNDAYFDYYKLSIVIVHYNIWVTEDNYNGSGFAELMGSCQNYWIGNKSCVQRDAVHLFTGKNMGVDGYTKEDACSPDAYSFSKHLNNGGGDRRGMIYGHEMGHHLNAFEDEGGDCSSLCITSQGAPLMCSSAVYDPSIPFKFTENSQCDIHEFIYSPINIACLTGQVNYQPPCTNCTVTGVISTDNNNPIFGCDGKDIINFTVKVCNSCYPQELLVQVNYDDEDVELISHDFDGVVTNNQGVKLLTSNDGFDDSECVTYHYQVKVVQASGSVPSIGGGILINGASLIGQPQSSIIIPTIANEIGQAGSMKSLQELINETKMNNAINACNPNFLDKKKLKLYGTLVVDIDYCLGNYDLVMMPGSSITVKPGNNLEIKGNTHLYGCDQLWQGITVEPGAALVMDEAVIEDAAYAVQLKGSQNISITNSTFDKNLIGIYVAGANPGQNQKIIFDALFGNTFDGTGGLLPPEASLSPGPALTFGSKPFAGIWVQNNLGSVLHSMDNHFTDLSNGIYTKRTSLKVTANSFASIMENGYGQSISGFGIRAESGILKGVVSGPRILQQVGLGNQPGVYTFQNCSKGIKATGMYIDYIKNNAMRVGKGIEINYPLHKATIEDNQVDVTGSIGIELNQPNPSVVVKVARNDIDISATVTDGIGIQYNTMGFDPVGNGQAEFTGNEIVLNASGAFGIQTNATNSTVLKQNLVTVGDGGANSRAFQANSDFNSLLTCNSAIGSDMAGNTTGFYMSDAESTDYSCNSTADMGTGVYFDMGSFSPEAFRETSFSGGDVGLKVSASAAIGTQTHKGNTWGGGFGSFGAEHGSSIPTDWDQSLFTVHTTNGSYYPSLPTGQNLWFPQFPGTPEDDCAFVACAISGPPPPGSEEGFNFDINIADHTFTISTYPTEIGWLANRYLYRKLTRNPLLVTLGSDYETFYNNESTTPIGGFSGVNTATSAIYDLDQSSANQLDSDLNSVTTSMETIASIDSQLVAQGQDSVLVQQRLQEMQTTGVIESDIDSLTALVHVQQGLDAVAVISQNDNIANSFLLESNKKTVNDIYLNTLGKGIVELDSLQVVDLSNIALQCPLTGGSAVYEARSLLELVQDMVYDDGGLCNRAQGRTAKEETVISDIEGFYVYPNPAKEQVKLLVPDEFLGGEIVLSNSYGSVIHRKNIEEDNSLTLLQTGHLSSGIYQVVVFEKGKKVFTKKLVIVH